MPRARLYVATFLATASLVAASHAAANKPEPPAPRTRVELEAKIAYVERPTLAPLLLCFPKSFDATKTYPLVIGLHGRGGTAQAFLQVWESWRDPEFIYAVPEAPYPLGSAWSWDFPYQDRHLWERADPLICQYIFKVVEEVQKQARVGDIYLLAHSQGVAYAYLTALLHPGRIQGLVCFAGIYPAEFLAGKTSPEAGKGLRVYLAHGSEDPMLPLTATEEAQRALVGLGAQVTLKVFIGEHNLPGPMLREVQAWLPRGGKP